MCIGAIGIAALAAGSAWAQDAATSANAQEGVTLQTIDVNGANGPPLQQVPSMGKTGTPIGDIPASIQIIPREVVTEQGGTDLRAAIRNVSGVSEGGGSSYGFFDRFLIRGMDPRIYSDGFSDGDQTNGLPHSLNGVERIEVLKGPGSALFGSGPPGGSINIVHYLPPITPIAGVTTQFGSFGNTNTQLYAGGPTSTPGLNYRIDALVQHADGFRDLTSGDYELRPEFSWTANDHVLTVAFDGRKIQRTPDPQGLIYYHGAPINMPITTSYTTPFSHGNQEYGRFTAVDVWTPESYLTVSTRFSYTHRDVDILRDGDSGTVVGSSFTGRSLRHQHDLDDDIDLQMEPVWKFATGSVGHTLLTGVEVTQKYITTHRETAALPNIGNIFAPVVPEQNVGGLSFVPNFQDKARATYLSAYSTDQIDLTDKWKLRVGGRVDYWDASLTPQIFIPGRLQENGQLFQPGVTYGRIDTPVSWNAGTLYHLLPGVTPYIGVQRGYLANFNSEADTNGIHKPESSLQYEAGVKFETLNGFATLTTAAFDTQRADVFTQTTINGVAVITFNSQETKGVEADLTLQPTTQWKILANATAQQAELTLNPSQPATVGNQPIGVPSYIANLWSTYDFRIGNVDGFRIGGGMNYRAHIYGDALNTNSLPAYTLFDAVLSYNQPTWDIAVGIKNIGDTRYFVTANGSGGFVGDPRTYFIKASWRL
jgi:iron complex outermembrane receptor protein